MGIVGSLSRVVEVVSWSGQGAVSGHDRQPGGYPVGHATAEVGGAQAVPIQQRGGGRRAASGSADGNDLPVGRELGEVLGQLGERNVDGVGGMAGAPFARFADIDQHRSVLESLPASRAVMVPATGGSTR